MSLRIFPPRIKSFLEIYLSPAERLSEIIFGLIMVLTITSTLKIALTDGEAGIRTMAIAALGCNAAWGIVDGAMYIFTGVFERDRCARLVSCIKSTPDNNSALAAIENELEPTILWVLDETERKRIYTEVLKSASRALPQESKITKDDFFGAISCFLIVFFSTFPVLIPLLVVQNLDIATRISNLVAIGMLFFIGYEWAKYTNRNRFKAGMGMVLIGSSIVGVTLALGG